METVKLGKVKDKTYYVDIVYSSDEYGYYGEVFYTDGNKTFDVATTNVVPGQSQSSIQRVIKLATDIWNDEYNKEKP